MEPATLRVPLVQSLRYCLVLAILTSLLISGTTRAQGEEQALPLSNLEVMREIAGEIGARAGQVMPGAQGDTVAVLVRPAETAWYVESSLLQGIRESGYLVVSGEGGRISANFGIAELAVRYSDPRSHGILGETVVDRDVNVTVFATILNNSSNEVVYSEDMTGTRRDTVALSAIRSLENPLIAVTQGEIPG
jgi:hypothetical protein